MTDLTALRMKTLPHIGYADGALPRFSIATMEHPTEVGAMIYDPVVCLVLQGAKRVFIGDDVLDYGAGHCMIVAAELTALAQISVATPELPYIALNIRIDPAAISALLLEMRDLPEVPTTSAFGVTEAGPALLDAWSRYLDLLDTPGDIPVMAHHREHELMFRLMMGSQGGLLRQIASSDSRLSHIRRAMAWIRQRFAEHLSIEDMAAIAGMSVSVFHRHFKAVTGLSPLQYQKQIRLHEARRKMVADGAEAASVGFAVGYESASQFSREYKRLFGQPPRRDAEAIQAVATVP